MHGAASLKQSSVIEVIANERQVNKIYLIGALGTSKTYVMAMVLISIARQYPGSFIPVGRKTIAEARVGTVLSFIEVLANLNLRDGKHYRGISLFGGTEPPRFVFENGSIIQFIPLDHTKDREWQRIKGINATAAGVDEVDGVMESGFDMLAARVGRKNTEIIEGYPPPAIIIAACNPNEAWVKEKVYLPYKRGTLPADTRVIEFDMTDSFLYPSGFYDRYADNPPQWRQRYLMNNWDYLDDDMSLFKSKILDNIMVDDYNGANTHYAGQDVAREGTDRSVTAQIVGNVLTDIVIYRKEDLDYFATDEEKQAPPYSNILGRKFIEYCTANSIGYQHAAGDAVGLGAGFIDYCRGEKFYVDEYKAGSKATEGDFDMIRSQLAVMLANDMANGDFYLYEGCPFLAELKKELLYHQYQTRDKIMKVESKGELKKRLGRSPDVADAVFIAYWKMKVKRVGTFDILPPVEKDPTNNNPEASTTPGNTETERPITGGLMEKKF